MKKQTTARTFLQVKSAMLTQAYGTIGYIPEWGDGEYVTIMAGELETGASESALRFVREERNRLRAEHYSRTGELWPMA